MEPQFEVLCQSCKTWAVPKLSQDRVDQRHFRTSVVCPACGEYYWFMEKQMRGFYERGVTNE